ncbi:hypothetical protein DNAM_340 [Pseudomonas phage BroderSalsa]|nr:hypothetical protein DNAM_340 [Pseudomonas phage BroderSalsa]
MEMYRNDNYKIVGNAELGLYQVINIRSDIVEYENMAFPKARIVAEQYNQAIKEPTNVVELKAVR